MLRRCVPVLALLALACATVVNPVTGKREWSTMSPAQEEALGARTAQQVEEQMGLVDDPELVAYVDAIGQRMARRSPRQDVTYKFNVADMPEPNAFALPGGWIYVSRGLLVIANSEAELANVIGHEIGHVAARHADQRQTRATGVGILTALGAVVAGALGGGEAAQTVGQLGQVAGAGYIASYGRDQERQSDEVGQKLAAESGWDPAGMPAFLATLERVSVLRTGQTRRPSFMDSHPVTAERVRDTDARARELPRAAPAPIARNRAEFLARIEGIVVGTDPAEGVFQGQRFLHPDLDFVVDFPRGWQVQNGKSAVAAGSPEGDAVLVLQLQGPSGDPRRAAADFAQQSGIQLAEGQSGSVGGWPAYRSTSVARTRQGSVALDLTWIAHPAATFRLMGQTGASRAEAYERVFLETARSFRGLTRSERRSIRERRLRVVTARRGESLAALSRRTGNVWSVDETAVANGLDTSARLGRGDRIKIAVEVSYGG